MLLGDRSEGFLMVFAGGYWCKSPFLPIRFVGDEPDATVVVILILAILPVIDSDGY